MFLLAFLANLVQSAVSLADDAPGGASAPVEPGGRLMVLAWLGFAICTGCGVAFVRRRCALLTRKNLATGVVVGTCYAGACLLAFGAKLPAGLGTFAVVFGVWVGITYAVSSGLNEVFKP